MNALKLIDKLEQSALAYCDMQSDLLDKNLIAIDDMDSGIQCFIRTPSINVLGIAFRGTDSLRDAFANAKFWKKKTSYHNTNSNIKIHSGFSSAYESQNIHDRIVKFVMPNIDRIEITGHSYGAALAVLCAIDLKYHFPDKDFEVTLFGCPRVGNKEFARLYNQNVYKTIRVENGNDVVTKIPFLFMGYRHVGTCVHIGARRIVGFFSFKAHKSKDYYDNLCINCSHSRIDCPP